MPFQPRPMKLDEIGEWSIAKLDILQQYSTRYSAILARQKAKRGAARWSHGYIDGFAGAGIHVTKATKKVVPGSPLNALTVKPAFDDYHFVELDPQKAQLLREFSAGIENVTVYEGNCNTILLEQVFPKFRFTDYRRGLCFLDPYGMQLNWEVIAAVAKTGTIEIFLNFPIMDINRNVKRDDATEADKARLTAVWGDDSWRKAMYSPSRQGDLFGFEEIEKVENTAVAEAFRARLANVAGFAHVPKPVAMKNSKGAVVYYLYFAGPNSTGNRIASYILNRFRESQ
jgi:three-Cys-motif partner protein